MVKQLLVVFITSIIANLVFLSEAKINPPNPLALMQNNPLASAFNQAAGTAQGVGLPIPNPAVFAGQAQNQMQQFSNLNPLGGGVPNPMDIAGAAQNQMAQFASFNPLAGRELGVTSNKKQKQYENEDSGSDEEPRHHHHHHHHHHSNIKDQRQYAASAVNQQRQEQKQLESSGGGFNANLNQNNNFSPNFGNVGNIGGPSGRQFEDNEEPNVAVEPLPLEYVPHRKHGKSYTGYPKRFSNPEYFFDFRQVFLPRDGSSSEEDDDVGAKLLW